MTDYKQATPLRITTIVNGELVGAIGVSSAQPDRDAQIAAASAAALAAP
jgi:uncharacterized protein GlcG (DUF336 family)